MFSIPSVPLQYTHTPAWIHAPWKPRKPTHAKYDEYVYLARDGVVARKRNLAAVAEAEEAALDTAEMAETIKRIRSNPVVFRLMKKSPKLEAWREPFRGPGDALRWPILIVSGKSHSGKTELVKSLSTSPVELKIGSLPHFPAKMRQFSRKLHDGLVVDDVRAVSYTHLTLPTILLV